MEGQRGVVGVAGYMLTSVLFPRTRATHTYTLDELEPQQTFLPNSLHSHHSSTGIIRVANMGEDVREREKKVSVFAGMMKRQIRIDSKTAKQAKGTPTAETTTALKPQSSPEPPDMISKPPTTKLYDLPSTTGSDVKSLAQLRIQLVIKAKILLLERNRMKKFKGGYLPTVCESAELDTDSKDL